MVKDRVKSGFWIDGANRPQGGHWFGHRDDSVAGGVLNGRMLSNGLGIGGSRGNEPVGSRR